MLSKRENIAEYILHLWQLESLVRIAEKQNVSFDDEFLLQLQQMMHTEGVMDSGHTQIARVALSEVESLNTELINTDAIYRAAMMQIVPQLAVLKSKSDNPSYSDVEMMFIFLYDVMQLRREGRELSTSTQTFLNQVQSAVRYLAKTYKTQSEQ